MDAGTQAFYDANAAAYADYAADKAERGWLARFAEGLPPGARVLDYGCGSGWAGGWLLARGIRAEGLDASAALAAEARARHGLAVRVAPFEALDEATAYDGIWASFSLLHAARAELPGLVGRIGRALVPGGRAYLGMKEGAGEARDRLGRRYTYVTAAELAGWLAAAGLVPSESATEAGRGYAGRPERFLHVLARRRGDGPA